MGLLGACPPLRGRRCGPLEPRGWWAEHGAGEAVGVGGRWFLAWSSHPELRAQILFYRKRGVSEGGQAGTRQEQTCRSENQLWLTGEWAARRQGTSRG